MDYFQPIFAFGKSGSVILRLQSNSGVKTFTFGNDPEVIAVGDHVFCSNSDDTHPQYLGLCKTSSTTAITTEIATDRDRPIGSKLWKPTQAFRFSSTARVIIDLVTDSGIVTELKRDGKTARTQVSDARYDLRMLVAHAPDSDALGYWAWWMIYRKHGLETATIAHWERDGTHRCREISDSMRDRTQNRVTNGFSSWERLLHIENFDTYVSS